MKTIKIYCKNCHTKLTDELKEEQKDNLLFIENEDVLKKGKFAFIDENDANRNVLIVCVDEDDYLENHPDSSRFQGCCGASRFDSLNKTCSNGHEVATIITDCWIYHYIKFDLSKVIVKEKINDFEYRELKFNNQ